MIRGVVDILAYPVIAISVRTPTPRSLKSV